MKLTLDEIKTITWGAERIEEQPDGIHFYRFTEEQQALYMARCKDFEQHLATSGICLRFLTNSQTLYLSVLTTAASARNFFSFEIQVNGQFFGSIDNFYSIETPVFPQNVLPFGAFEKQFDLPAGEKEVRIYFPWSACGILQELSLDDGASIVPQKPTAKLICYGDSITQGYDALFPSHKYVTRLAEYLNAEEFNKAMGGDGIFPEIAPTAEPFSPDYITIAYGTNDWSCHSPENFLKYYRNFCENATTTYPNAHIYAIAPIWRKDYANPRKMGTFAELADLIKEAASPFDNVTFVPGFDLLDHNENLFRELSLHPNDAGFEQYFESLKKYIVKK